MSDKIHVSTDKSKLDIPWIHSFLTQSYWAKGRSLEQVKSSVDHSVCFGVYKNDQQIGFARVLTDYVAFAYIMDVFIIESERGNGYSATLMKKILESHDISGVQKWFLGTRDAQFLYQKFGFVEANKAITWMQLDNNK